MDFGIVIIILNLIILESLLSVDNAAVLAVMVSGLPPQQRVKALRYGIIGAYVFRGLCLLAASWLVKFSSLKALGGLYLIYLSYRGLTSSDEEKPVEASKSSFWGTVVAVELADLAFSIDNVFAAVALTDKFWVIMIGVGIGILAMRFVAGKFTTLIVNYPSLSKSAYVVILLLGMRLVLDALVHSSTNPILADIKDKMSSHSFDLIFSGIMMIIFFLPLMRRRRLHA